MDSISSALAASQAVYQSKLGASVLKMAVQSDQQMAALLAQITQAGQAQAANPAGLGQSLDTFA
ncbi:MAG: putative motility protein [Parasulfuritortus sp.]|nr:putative motility protein [Parasulfuritortus sp.]